MELPPYLYKYRRFDSENHALEGLRNSTLYFSANNEMNDPFECRALVTSGHSSNVKSHLDSLERQDDGCDSSGEVGSMVKAEAKYLNWSQAVTKAEAKAQAKLDSIVSSSVFCCFSSVGNNILMFSHYSDNHTGFCIGFDTKNSPFTKARRVMYKDCVPIINMSKLMRGTEDECKEMIGAIFETKAKMWSYEEEWRCITLGEPQKGEPKKLRRFTQKAIVEVILGCRIHPDNEAKILEILSQKKHKVPVYRAKQKQGQYALELEPVNY